jgi:hypothetical protein
MVFFKKKYKKYIENFNNSKLLTGLCMIILNLFSKHIELKFSKTQEEYIKNSITREILIFTIVFIGTHDIIMSLLITSAFLVMSNTIFNENSRFCIMSEKYKKLHKELDTNNDNIISDLELENAKEILGKANNNQTTINNINSF